MMHRVLLADFFSGLGRIRCTVDLDVNASRDEAGSGAVNRATYGTRLWRGEVSIRPEAHAQMSRIEAKMNYLKEADVIFEIEVDWRQTQTVSTGLLNAIDPGDRRRATFSTALQEGDFFGCVFGDAKSLHHVAFVDGLDHVFTPPLPYAAQAGETLYFGRNKIDAMWVEGVSAKYDPAFAEGLSFSWQQFY